MFRIGNQTGYPEGDIAELFLTGIAEVLQYGIYLGIVLLIAFFVRKMDDRLKYAAAGITTAAGLYHLAADSVKTEFMMSVLFALMLVFIVFVYDILSLDVPMLLLMFTAFLFPQRLFNSSFGVFGYGVIYLVIWVVLMLFFKLQDGQGNRAYMAQYVLFVCLSLAAFFYKSIEDINYTAYCFAHVIGKLEFALLEAGLVLLFVMLAFLAKKKWGARLQALTTIDRKYPDIKKWILASETATMAVILLLPLPFVLTRTISDVLQSVLAILDISFLVMQLFCIALIYKIVDYRHTVQFQNGEKEYYSSLNQNPENIQNLRHDIKNIFLTMSAYVERSEDGEMKEFYKSKISPMIECELEYNTIFSKLYHIPSEELRAFLYMKCMQAFQSGIAVKLSVDVNEAEFGYGMELVDLTRILGILLDNAIEECSGVQNAFLEIHIRTQGSQISYSIKNSIRKGHNFEHMIERKSDKAGHAGRGLKIIKNILDGYPNVTLNTVVDQEVFHQTLNLTL